MGRPQRLVQGPFGLWVSLALGRRFPLEDKVTVVTSNLRWGSAIYKW